MDRLSRSNSEDLSTVVNVIVNTLNGISRSAVDPTHVNGFARQQLEQIRRNVDRLRPVLDAGIYSELQVRLRTTENLIPVSEESGDTSSGGTSLETEVGRRGRPKYVIDIERLEHLLSLGYSVRVIARDGLLGGKLHYNTLTNFMKRNHIRTTPQRYSPISDDELKLLIQEINTASPNSGIRDVLSRLRSRNPPIVVPFHRVSKMLPEVDPIGSARRWAQVIPRRTYHVATPNSLWHIDTHHSLIRWNFVVIGIIDGYSRLVPLLRVHTDNLASTAFNDFVPTIREYGIPSRVRADGGGEFAHIRRFMLFANGDDRGSFLVGKSTHNQRIERLWRDVFTKVCEKYYKTFHLMERVGILDIDNNVHVSTLHYVYARRIQADLDTFQQAHNKHKIRTENSKTPQQLWFEGSVRNSRNGLTAMQNIFQADATARNRLVTEFLAAYSLDEPDNIQIVLPRHPLPLTDGQMRTLNEEINVEDTPNENGIRIYAEVLRYIATCMGHA